MCACEFDWSLFANVISGVGSLVAAGFTIFIYLLAKNEWKRNNSISELDLYYRIKQDFDTEYSRKMYASVVKNKVSLGDKGHEKVLVISNTTEEDTAYFTHSFLGSFEDLALFHERELISFDTLNSGYGSMILAVGNNKAIVELIKYLRSGVKDGDNNYFSGFETLYKAVRETLEEEKKQYYRKDFGAEPEKD